MIPDYIREQVLNAKPPDGCCVPGGSVPAVAEGHFTFARAATVGINPHGSWNRKDYLPKECLTLDRDDLDEQFLNRVWEEKTRYFERNTHRYFTMLKPILNACGVTYCGKYGADRPDLACSLDLVQWPTDPLWSKLPGNGGTLKKCVNGQAVYPLSEQDGLKAQERRYTAYGKEKHWEQVGVKAGVGAVGGLGARPCPADDPGVAGGRGDGVSRKGEVGPQV